MFLLPGLMILPLLASSQHTMKMDHSGLEASKTFHAESLYHMNAEWTSQDGETIRLADYKGQPLMVVMFYGQCTGTCPVLMQRTWKLYNEIEEQVRDRVQVLAVSFDYKNDTPEALKAYAEYEQLDIPGWNFVTAQQSDIRELAMLLGVQYRERSDGHFEHSNLITVLDGQGKISVRNEGITGDLGDTTSAIEGLFKSELQ
ncbi:SCO family protein [Rhodohalobacter sp.]|uniref:SCO family protein n=1 Tax=Rhodohalobacter sp. TaxID=1974210 RepID=UPI002ACD4B79|nr:SCO family protein [Rhodohalobacter sp.]